VNEPADLTRELQQTWNTLERKLAVRLTEDGGSGLRSVHVAILRVLEPDGARVSDIARQLGITRQAVAQTVAVMLDRDIVEFVPDPTDGRAKLLRYTEHGRQSHRAALRAADEFEATYVKRVGQQRVDQLRTELAELRRIALETS
jgi:DNA-binding MarR family transcriptional regulator